MTSPAQDLAALCARELAAFFGLPVVTTDVPESAGVLGYLDDVEAVGDLGGLAAPTSMTVLVVLRGTLGAAPSEQRVTVGGVAYRLRGRAPGRDAGPGEPQERWRVVPATSAAADRGER